MLSIRIAWPPSASLRSVSEKSLPSRRSDAPTAAARSSTIAATLGSCSRTTPTFPGLMMSAFSAAISSTVEPSSRWSSEIGVITATSPATRFVASQRPPMPTSKTPACTGLSVR